MSGLGDNPGIRQILFPAKNGLCLNFDYNDPAGRLTEGPERMHF
jgi:hypothetical protein